MNTSNYFFDDYNNNIDNRQITYNNYMRFTSSTNNTLNNMLAIIQNQQISYHHIIRNIDSPRESIPRSLGPAGRNQNPPLPIRSIWNRAPGPRLPRFSRLPQDQYINSSNSTPTSIDILIGSIDHILYRNIDVSTNVSCPITQIDFTPDDVVIKIKNCNHCFMPDSIIEWFSRNTTCPLCRQNIQSNQSNSINDISNNIISNDNFIDQLANIISNQLTSEPDFSGNIQIELDIEGT